MEIARDFGLVEGAEPKSGGKPRNRKSEGGAASSAAAAAAAAAYVPLDRQSALAAAVKRREALALPHRLACGVLVTSLGAVRPGDACECRAPACAEQALCVGDCLWGRDAAADCELARSTCGDRASVACSAAARRLLSRELTPSALFWSVTAPALPLPPLTAFWSADRLWPAGFTSEWEDEKGVRFINSITETPQGPIFRWVLPLPTPACRAALCTASMWTCSSAAAGCRGWASLLSTCLGCKNAAIGEA